MFGAAGAAPNGARLSGGRRCRASDAERPPLGNYTRGFYVY
jgi:hypothetical protein